ncbi:C40 family peptidase, partial [Streptomyces parvulus]
RRPRRPAAAPRSPSVPRTAPPATRGRRPPGPCHRRGLPDRSFDCSGLTQWAYAQAGVGLPRTSQAQSGTGRRVSLSEARPGDLVAYRDDASHIGMYAGNGQVIHAPYPGAPVRYDPVGMMPVSSITRV